MKLISAKEAREMAESMLNDLVPIMEQIEETAKSGKNVLHVYHSLSKQVLDSLKDLGYRVSHSPSISVQEDGLYYSIYW